ncbi:hypothetical protein [Micromonospora sp. NPDC047730]|uniref:hypothetical protein n=1 Tax=Micromonospora sp. NPDC047730 TaxID=3364253 RepID=UPI0037210D16
MPEELRRQVIAELYRQADELDWDGLSPADRSAAYARWLGAPEIGGILDTYMTRDRARIWIKDTPMKHYTRARSGIGPYASLAASKLPGAEALARLAFGPAWIPDDRTLREKPNRCLLRRGASEIDMIWGPPRTFPALIWAGLNGLIDNAPDPNIVVVTKQGERLTAGQIERHRVLGQRVGVVVHHVSVSVVPGDGAARS